MSSITILVKKITPKVQRIKTMKIIWTAMNPSMKTRKYSGMLRSTHLSNSNLNSGGMHYILKETISLAQSSS